MTGHAAIESRREKLAVCAPASAMTWLSGATGGPERKLLLSYSSAARHFPHEPLDEHWTLSEAARACLLTDYPAESAESFRATCDRLCQSADVNELVAFYKTLPYLPFPEAHRERAAEGVRTNITEVFCAVAHGNSYPARYFDEVAWNTMVLKALFIGVPLAPMDGLDDRANEALMRMLCNYAHERWAAGRTVSAELWRCVGPYADDAAKADLQHVLDNGTEAERAAAARALEARE